MGRGGVRAGAGRKGFYGEKTIAVKIPISRVEAVKAFLRGDDSVIISNFESVTETNKGENTGCVQKLSEIEVIVERWKEKCTPERDKAARWEKANELFREICDALHKI